MCKLKATVTSELASLSRPARFKFDLFSKVFGDIDGSLISQKDRSGRNDDPSLTHGEITFVSFSRLLSSLGLSDGLVFYDLGSGVGKAVIAAALSGICFIKCVGIELLPGLSVAASDVCQSVRHLLQAEQTAPSSMTTEEKWAISSLRTNLPLMEMRTGDMLEEDFSDADVIFLSSLCFSDDLMQGLLKRCSGLKSGSFVITLKIFDGYQDCFHLEKIENVKMNFGLNSCYILRKR